MKMACRALHQKGSDTMRPYGPSEMLNTDVSKAAMTILPGTYRKTAGVAKKPSSVQLRRLLRSVEAFITSEEDFRFGIGCCPDPSNCRV